MKPFFSFKGDFAPVLSLSQKNIFVFPTQLPVKITTKDDPDLRQTLTTLRINHMEKFILHSMDREVVKNVIFAVVLLFIFSIVLPDSDILSVSVGIDSDA